jgi:hypothetical protein
MSKTNRIKHILQKHGEDHADYGLIPEGQNPPFHLLIKQASGVQVAFGYTHLAKEFHYDPSGGITLIFKDLSGSIHLYINGKHLDALWQALLAHKVTFIQPNSSPEEQGEDVLCVTEIRIEGMGE